MVGLIGIKLEMEPLRSLGFASIGAAYMGIGTPVDHPIRMYEIYNLTDQNLLFSIDGTNDHFPLPSNSYKILDIVTNRSTDDGWYMGKGTRFYVKEIIVTPTSGSVYVAVSYGT